VFASGVPNSEFTGMRWEDNRDEVGLLKNLETGALEPTEFLSPTGDVQHNLDDVPAASCPHPPWLKILPEHEGKTTRNSQE
jgi:hypothetical protein